MNQTPPHDPEYQALAQAAKAPRQVRPEEAGERLDKHLAQAFGISRGQARALIAFGAAWVEGKRVRSLSRPVAAGQTLTLYAPLYGPRKFYELDEARILYQDADFLAYDKEPGIPSQAAPFDAANNVHEAARRRQGPGGYVSLLHRLDRPTSGVLLMLLDPRFNRAVARSFQERRVEKAYLAVVKGAPAPEAWEADQPIAKARGAYVIPPDGRGRPARTFFRRLAVSNGFSLIEARPQTGRTHQIRLHLAHAGWPILGDGPHGGPPAARLMLHAWRLRLGHPAGKDRIEIEAPVPPEFSRGPGYLFSGL